MRHVCPLYKPDPMNVAGDPLSTGLPRFESSTVVMATIATGDDAYFMGFDEPCLILPGGALLPAEELRSLLAEMERLRISEGPIANAQGGHRAHVRIGDDCDKPECGYVWSRGRVSEHHDLRGASECPEHGAGCVLHSGVHWKMPVSVGLIRDLKETQ